MVDMVAVTLRAGEFSCDFELPNHVKLCELYPRILAALQKTNMRVFGEYNEIILETDGCGMLDLSATLRDYGICSGYDLDVVRKEKYDGFREG